MKKILNADVSNVVDEMLAGYLTAYRNFYKKVEGYNAFFYRGHRKNKVALVIGGGSGHEPLFSGFCGAGLADAVACGNICASPNPELIKEAAKSVEQGCGVLFVYGCYAGDNLNFDLAEELLQKEGIRTAHVRIWDDLASAPKERISDRRGIAGDVFVIKVAGAACDAGYDLEEVLRITEKARDHVNSIGIATMPCTLPGNEKPTFELGEDEMEYGMGIHGEPGIERTKMAPAEVIVERMYTELKNEMQLKNGEELAVLVNGLGSTPLLELNLVFYDLYRHLAKDGLKVYDADIKTYCTSQEMGGFSISFMRMDEELKKYYDAPCYSPYYAKGNVQITLMPAKEEELIVSQETSEETAVVRSKAGELSCLNGEDVRNMLIYVAQKVMAKKEYLTEIDSAVGDGDHGIGMYGGMKKVKKKMAAMTGEKNVYKLFEAAGYEMLNSMGGASGVIFGNLYLAGAQGMEEKKILDGRDLARMERKSVTAIQERGKAQKGDKTMVDALLPAVEAMEANCGKSLLNVLRAAEAAAKQGMEDTKNYTAKFGRAKSLMERAIGYQDAGATSVWLIFEGMREFVEDKMEK